MTQTFRLLRAMGQGIIIVMIFSLPFIMFAQSVTTSNPPTTSTDITQSDMLQNPLGSIKTIPDFIAKVLEIIVKIGTPIVVIFIIYAGFLFVAARGNETKLKHAKETLLWTIVGAALLLGSWILAQAIVGTINELK